jgi:hypothetical protein
MPPPPTLLEAAEEIMEILGEHRVDGVVIGAVAMAAHHYVRTTQDLDLGVNADVATLKAILKTLGSKGFVAELNEPDGNDPLGGVLDIRGEFGWVQIISFADRFPAAIHDALLASPAALRPHSRVKIAPLPQLIALKLYAGGLKSKADVLELLKHNPEADIQAIRATCRRYRVRGLAEILRELRMEGSNA